MGKFVVYYTQIQLELYTLYIEFKHSKSKTFRQMHAKLSNAIANHTLFQPSLSALV